MAQFGYVGCGTTAAILCRIVSLCGRVVCDLVTVRADRTGSRGGETWPNWMAILDEIGGGHGGLDRRCGLHVHSMSTVFAFVQSMACTKQVHHTVIQ